MTRTIFAYLDPGSMSMFVQLLLGGFAAAAVALKLWWRKILKFLHLRKDDPKADPVASPAGEDPIAVRAEAAHEPVETGKR